MPNQKKWTVMVYIAGDNNLDPAGTGDLNEMKRVGTTADLNVIAQYDSTRANGTKRYCLRKGTSLAADMVGSLGVTNTGDPKFLTDFITWGVKNYPADHYLLVLWNHGNGWDDTDVYAGERGLRRMGSSPVRHALFRTPVRRLLAKAKKDARARAILFDDGAKDFLDNHEMKAVLASAKKVLKRNLDILGMDACLMSMAEVGYQVRGSVDFTVGSEQVEPGDGWPYDTVLAELAKNPSLTPRDVASLVVDKYVASYPASSPDVRSDGVTQAACDLAKSPALAAAVKTLATALQQVGAADAQKILSARARVQTYRQTRDYVDLVDLCSALASAGLAANVTAACRGIIQSVQAGYVIKSGWKGSAVKNSNGVSIYFPINEVSPLYAGLDFCKQTGWDKFLKKFLATIRGR